MIAFLQPLPVGNAVRCLLAPDAAALKTRVLRKTQDDFSGPADADAAIVYEGDERHFIDTATLQNGAAYFYKAYDLIGATWTGSASHAVTPQAVSNLLGPNVLTFVLERLAAGLKVEVAAGRLKHATGAIPCFTAPPAFEGTKWPVASVHLSNDAAAMRGLGEAIDFDAFDIEGDEWRELEGWFARVQLSIVVWSLNSDERNLLRLAVKKVLLGNLAVFEAAGISQVEFSQSDTEDMESHAAPVYSSICSFTCLAPVAVDALFAPIADAAATLSAT
ncbi:hypothetical protein [Phenylobacterium ferrooxidans]|uniref:Uncharacterized protein n=1 Tax=Phenylobacterium ferrooxidans TaxID=2982689 RepID=A0ABW6CN20_9CAUL